MSRKTERYPIDFVIPWVDGTDPAWLAEKEKYSGEMTGSTYAYCYREWGLLKYWFRAVEKNAPWVRRIHFVTWGHLPEWLNTENPKLHVVKHGDYIPEEYLPTFSANTIELNAHRIPGLSEHFVYFNDDTYLTRRAKPEDFFLKGKPRDIAVINPIAPAGRNKISHMMLTDIGVINEYFRKHEVIRKHPLKWYNLKYGKLLPLNLLFMPWGRFPGLLEMHLPNSFLKSTFLTLWEKEPELLDATCRHTFRDFKTDVNQWLVREWQVASGNFYPRSTSCGRMINVLDRKTAEKAADCVRKKKYMMYCVNDHFEEAQEDLMQIVIDAFEEVFPDRSSFELPAGDE
ncbi:MAG: Stealth CR1 domain-containing protein [Lachnospiraceae bacterium]|nr:Stealth CR1 domain-containing protein [Lachnospiraceae bacterium]